MVTQRSRRQGSEPSSARESHHRLMMGVHPDHGGSTYLAVKLNQGAGCYSAREILVRVCFYVV